jgi:anaerobic selenocysteine-containing dehydrogenase
MQEKTFYRACNLCEAICGLEFKVRGDKIVSIKGDPADPFSRGHICPKAVALQDIHEDPDRLRRPMRRTAHGWEELSWDAALDLVAERLVDVHRTHGTNSIATYLGNPTVHNYGLMTHFFSLLGPIKTKSRYSATSVDQLPHQLAAYWMYGHLALIPITDIDRTHYFLVLGGNPLVSNGSMMTVPDMRGRLKALQARGGKLVVLDPRRSETAAAADEHHFVRPGSDAAFLLGFLKVLLDEGLARPGRLAQFSDGLDEVARLVTTFDLRQLAGHCGISAETMQRLAREFAAADGAACYGRIGVCTQRYGSLCQWLIQLINIYTGNLDRTGGLMFTRPAWDVIDSPTSKPGHFGAWSTRISGLPEFAGELPVVALAEEILTPGTGQIRALVTGAGNPVLSTPNGPRLERALADLELMVSLDFYVNETTRFAHVILPPTCTLEHDHYDLAFNINAVRNVARYNAPVFPKPAGTMHDWEICSALGVRIARALGVEAKTLPPPDRLLAHALKTGPYAATGLSFEQLEQAPHGIDLGPLEPSLPQRLHHADKRIRCDIPEMRRELQKFADELQQPAASPVLQLIGRRDVRSNNSWMHNYTRLVKGPPRDRLWMHPDDLAQHGLRHGARARVRSRVGEVTVEVEANEQMMRGVVSLPHGWGHHRAGVQLQTAQAHAGVSCNDLTDECHLDFTGTAALNGVPVTVEPLSELDAPGLRALSADDKSIFPRAAQARRD